ncbi:peroxiredoxin-like family protein [Caenimonas soli]|uniref:peroxiredoxin-like family protein n=1 Tax=Caenimonas soli TaxID=2735555 RepID=UPI0015520D06|nr:peroxiredoxin-like family protein [Caenimonas soli]NPC58510.1 AhpC/TSA family protein [Caenimonas soli]
MSLQQKLDALREHLQVRTRTDALVAMLRVVGDAVSTDRAAMALSAASHAPGFTLPNERHNCVSLADQVSSGPVVLVFYRGQWCPCCTRELRAVQLALSEIRELGGSVLAITPQTEMYNRRCVRALQLDFPVLHDPHGRTADWYRVNWQIPESLRELYLGLDLDLPKFNGDAEWSAPLSSFFVVDQTQTVVYTEIRCGAPQTVELAGVLTALASVQRLAPSQHGHR